MPKLKNKVPSYRRHKATGQAVVTLNGKDIYLGAYNSAESREAYQTVLNEWLANHRRRPSTPKRSVTPADGLTINEVFLDYWAFVREYYRKYGKPTSEVASIKRALTPLLKLYGRQSSETFGPLALKACRHKMIESGLTRGVINNHIGRVKRFFKWAAENELVPPEVYHGLQTVSGLRRGRSPAPESAPVKPVPDERIDAVLKHVNQHVAAMIQLQRFTGMRPGEVIMMRACDLDTSGKVWLYRPSTHKTEHHNRERLICLGPRAQGVVRPFLVDDLRAYLFSPKLAMAEHRENLRANRKTPLTPSQRRRRPKRNPKKRPGECYTIGSYEHAINRGCDKAFPPPKKLNETEVRQWRKDHRWSPNQLRHSAATFLRKEFGIEAARVVLGHSSAAITEVYAELDRGKAADIMAQVG
ncbi:MAG: site-specific integrase [Phycisphaerales bacterium]|nr:site-specific integrase [Phycisphaerales bacterium]